MVAPAALTDEHLMTMRSIHDVLVYHTHFPLESCRPRSTVTTQPEGGEAGEGGPAATGAEASAPAITAENVYTRMCQILAENSELVPDMRGASSFRVTCSHSGRHSFTSKEIEFEAGGALQEFYNVPAQMRGALVNVRVDVVGPLVVVATQLNETELSRRHKEAFLNRVTIKSNIAYVMLQASRSRLAPRLILPETFLLNFHMIVSRHPF